MQYSAKNESRMRQVSSKLDNLSGLELDTALKESGRQILLTANGDMFVTILLAYIRSCGTRLDLFEFAE